MLVMGMIKEFKAFALRGNLIDTAVAFVMGASFGKITSSVIEGIVMPIRSMLTGGGNFNSQKIVLKEGIPEVKDAAGKVITKAVEEVAIKYGTFLTSVIDFVVIAIFVFLVIKAIIAMKKKEEDVAETPAEPSSTDKLLMEIRDALNSK